MKLKYVLLAFLIPSICLGGWDNTKPADNTTWNSAAGLVRNNWDALENIFGVDLTLASKGALGVYNVKSSTYGATGDGVADDTAEIQAAVDAAGAAGGGIVYIPEGTYLISAAIALTSSHQQVIIMGDGKNSTIIDGGAAAIYGFTLVGVTYLNIENIRIYDCATGGIDIKTTACSNILFDDIRIRECGIGINISTTISRLYVCDSLIDYNTGFGFKGTSTCIIGSSSFTNTEFIGNDDGGLTVDGSAGGIAETAFRSCNFSSNEGAKTFDPGANARKILLDNCHFENNGVGNATAYDVYLDASSRANTITGCTFSYLHTDASTAAYSIYATTSVYALVIQGNNFAPTRANYLAVYVHPGAYGVTLEGNAYYDTSQRYITPGRHTRRSGDGLPTSPDGYIGDGWYGMVETTDATVTVLWSHYFTEANTAFYIIADVLAVESAGGDRAAYTRKCLMYDDGTLTLQGAVEATTTIESAAAWDCTFAASGDSGGTIKLNVTGAAGKTIRWVASVRGIMKTWTN